MLLVSALVSRLIIIREENINFKLPFVSEQKCRLILIMHLRPFSAVMYVYRLIVFYRHAGIRSVYRFKRGTKANPYKNVLDYFRSH